MEKEGVLSLRNNVMTLKPEFLKADNLKWTFNTRKKSWSLFYGHRDEAEQLVALVDIVSNDEVYLFIAIYQASLADTNRELLERGVFKSVGEAKMEAEQLFRTNDGPFIYTFTNALHYTIFKNGFGIN